jgi:hypothetical protein
MDSSKGRLGSVYRQSPRDQNSKRGAKITAPNFGHTGSLCPFFSFVCIFWASWCRGGVGGQAPSVFFLKKKVVVVVVKTLYGQHYVSFGSALKKAVKTLIESWIF